MCDQIPFGGTRADHTYSRSGDVLCRGGRERSRYFGAVHRGASSASTEGTLDFERIQCSREVGGAVDFVINVTATREGFF